MTRIFKQTSRQSGVTLIELLAAVTISLVLLLGVGSVYYNSKRTYLVQEEFAHLQEGARIAVNFMVKDIRKAGFVGCVWNNNFDTVFESFLGDAGSGENDDATDDFGVAVSGFEASNSGPGDPINLVTPPTAYSGATLPTYFNAPNPPPLAGSDIIIMRYADGNGVRMTRNNDAAQFFMDDLDDNSLDVNGCHLPSGICEGHLLIATDCQKSRLFQATNLQGVNPGEINVVHAGGPMEPGNDPAVWAPQDNSEFETDDTYLFRALSVAYYIANNLDGDPALFRLLMQPGATADELITGVENMQILYGVDSDKILDNNILTNSGDGVANSYVTANNVDPASENVVSVRFSLLLRTTNEVSSKSTTTPDPQTYLLTGTVPADGTRVTATADRRIRKVFTTTVKVRNKGIQ